MQNIQNSIDEFLKTIPEQAIGNLVDRKLSDLGVKLSRRGRKRLIHWIQDGSRDTLAVSDWRWWQDRTVTLDFTADDLEELTRKIAEVGDRIQQLVQPLIEETSDAVLADLRKRWPDHAKWEKRTMSGFRKRLQKRYQLPFQSLRMLIALCRELGDTVQQEIRTLPQASNMPHLIDVLSRLHARACQIAEEVACLLESGFADGAMARWRTLHEIAVIARLIANHGEEIAERYTLHQVVESKRAIDDFEKCRERLGYEPISDAEVKRIQTCFAALIQQFGKDYAKGDYGWAAHHLGKTQPTFRDLEQAAGTDHLRSHFRMASHNVHANPKGMFFHLGLLTESQILLSGPSDAGLAEPGQCMGLSLSHVTAALAGLQTTFDNTVSLNIISKLVRENAELFASAEQQLKRDAANGG